MQYYVLHLMSQSLLRNKMLFFSLCTLIGVTNGQISFDKAFDAESEIQVIVSRTIELQSNTNSSEVCSTNEEGPSKNEPCIFPFIFSGQTYDSCTQEFDDQLKFWCSTKVTADNYHIIKEGNWGYCGSNCV